MHTIDDDKLYIARRIEEIEREYADSEMFARQETLKNALLRLVPEESRGEAEDYIEQIWEYAEAFNEYIYKRALADAVMMPDFYKNTQ